MKGTLMFLIIIVFVNTIFTNQISGHSNVPSPTLMSESAIVIDTKTGKVLYEKDSHTKMYPASLTKIATAIYAIEKGNINETVTVSKKARDTGGSKVYLEEGEQVTLKKLIQGLLINSGNDAGVAIAEHLSGSVEQFSSDINEYVKNEIGVKNTTFKNPHGLFDPKHVTTAADLAKMTQYAMNDKLFEEIFGMEELEWDGKSWDTTLITHHKLLREIPYEGITGGKTGFVNQSGFTLATSAERNMLSIIVVTLNSNLKSEAYNDTINLLDYTFENFRTSSIPKGTKFTFDGHEYRSPEEFFYTYTLNDQIKREVKNNGILEIINQDDIIIGSFPLEKIKTEVNKMNNGGKIINKKNKNIETPQLLENHSTKEAIYVLLLILTGIILFLFHQTRKINLKSGKKE